MQTYVMKKSSHTDVANLKVREQHVISEKHQMILECVQKHDQ